MSIAVLLLSALLLTGCGAAGLRGISAQSSQASIQAANGAPTAVYGRESGDIWFYDGSPGTLQRERLVFDNTGQLAEHSLAWSRERFEQIELGIWQATDLLWQFGPPIRQEEPRSSIFDVANFSPSPEARVAQENMHARERVWTYGLRERQLFHHVYVRVSADSKVVGVSIEVERE